MNSKRSENAVLISKLLVLNSSKAVLYTSHKTYSCLSVLKLFKANKIRSKNFRLRGCCKVLQ